ncbi:lytic murein transglycosylase [Pseudolabrys taiwanensis]|uniref:Lytic murein transglycosylase n=1 Tax=Pseudolabrys taiwanensis TaxID=331696 RepID=A0A346A1S0_9HYPH|nr:lytic murein transglycosylase [Pseudolabrys taiwanensis]AXK83117.1 lytic murein transglycosylase [Pseudolabrys taiwanensis]
MRRGHIHLIAAALAVTACSTATAQTQRADLYSGPTGSIGPAKSVARTAAPVWSGESGASGHPQMDAAAIRSGAANFHTCIERMWPLAARRGVSRNTYQAFTAPLTPDLRIMDLLDNQPEFTKSFWDYLDVLVTDERIRKGREILEKHRATFDAAERAYGVDRYVIAAIWGVETNYGTIAGDRPVLRSTATLACIGRRQAYFRDEFLATMEILQHGDVRPEKLVGSWAGAFGPTQFMPTAFKRYAVDFDHDGRRDVIDSMPDLIASTANNLKKNGWVPGQTWGYEVVVPANFNFLLAENRRRMSLREWQRHGILRANGQPFPRGDDMAFLLVPAGVQGPGFLMLENFRAIMRYNPAEAYALAIGHLSDRLRGGGPFVQDWPRYEKVLTRAERLELQELLARHGYDVGEPDGRLGARTRSAIRDFQARLGHVPDGFASASVLEQLRAR